MYNEFMCAIKPKGEYDCGKSVIGKRTEGIR